MSELTKKYIGVLRDVDNPKKDKTADVKKYKYNYADLAQVLGIVKNACIAHDLTVYQYTQIEDGSTYLCTAITDGEEERELAFSKMPESTDAQALGSWITYMRRYQLLIAFGLAPEDDDGQRAKVIHDTPVDALTAAQQALVEAEKVYCKVNGIDDWGEFHRNVIMKRGDYANDASTLTNIAAELRGAS